MPTSVQNGTVTLTLNSETTLGSAETSNKVLILVLDLGNIVNGETVEVKIYTIALASGTERLAYSRRYKHAQATPIKYSVPVPADVSFRATLKQTGGTGRAVPWKILQP